MPANGTAAHCLYLRFKILNTIFGAVRQAVFRGGPRRGYVMPLGHGHERDRPVATASFPRALDLLPHGRDRIPQSRLIHSDPLLLRLDFQEQLTHPVRLDVPLQAPALRNGDHARFLTHHHHQRIGFLGQAERGVIRL